MDEKKLKEIEALVDQGLAEGDWTAVAWDEHVRDLIAEVRRLRAECEGLACHVVETGGVPPDVRLRLAARAVVTNASVRWSAVAELAAALGLDESVRGEKL